MNIHRFYIAAEVWDPDRLALDGAEAHHAADVLRLGPGDRVTVFNGKGAEATAEIVGTGKHRVELRKLAVGKTAPLACAITLAQAVPKGRNMDFIVQKATELGAASIAPLLSERTVVQVSDESAEKKQEKWQATVIEAAKQCGQNWLPAVEAPRTLKAFFADAPEYDLMLIASLQPGARHLKAVLAELPQRPKSALVLVGPEGDFTPAEIALARGAGCHPITLGPIVLRTETAALYCLSILGHELLHG